LQGPDACDACVNVKDGPNCVTECPPCKYRDEQRLCQWCHPNCDKDSTCTESPRCTGPGAHLGLGGCTECAGLLLDHQEGVGSTECLNQTLTKCESGFYFFGGTIKIPSNSLRGFDYRKVVSQDGCNCAFPLGLLTSISVVCKLFGSKQGFSRILESVYVVF